MTAAAPAAVPARRLQLLDAELYERAGNERVPIEDGEGGTAPATWLLLKGGGVIAGTDEQLSISEAVEWAADIAEEDYGETVTFRPGRVDERYWLCDLAGHDEQPVGDPEPVPTSAAPSRKERRKARRAARADAKAKRREARRSAAQPDDDDADRRPGRFVTWWRGIVADPPRFVHQQPPSLTQAIDFARRGGWSHLPPGAPGRWWHRAYTAAVAVPLMALGALLLWAAPRPGRLLPLLVIGVVVATAVNLLPLGDALIPDPITVTYWIPSLGGSR